MKIRHLLDNAVKFIGLSKPEIICLLAVEIKIEKIKPLSYQF